VATNTVLLIVIIAVVLLGPALIMLTPSHMIWGRGAQEDPEPESRELPELLRRPPRPRSF
jgi:hypothetical protein